MNNYPVLKQHDIVIIEGEMLIITLDHNNEFSLAHVDQDDLEISPAIPEEEADFIVPSMLPDLFSDEDYERNSRITYPEFDEAHSGWVRGLNVPTQEEVDEFLDDLRESGVTNMFGAVTFIMEEFKAVTKEEAQNFLIKWMNKVSPLPGSDVVP